MQFLHEEFFGKIYKYIKEINVTVIRIIAKLIFWAVIFGILVLLAVFYYTGKQKWVFWILGLLLAAETAHFLRKSRERTISMKREESSNIQDQLAEADVIKKEKPKKKSKPALNQGLLKKSTKIKIIKKESINKGGLLKKKITIKN